MSTLLPVSEDLIAGDLRTGVQLVDTKVMLKRFDGIIACRPLDPPLTQSADAALTAFARQTHGLPFNRSPYYAMRAKRRRNQQCDGGCYYCTELVAAALQSAGVLESPPRGRSASNYLPGDFAEPTEQLCLAGVYGFLAQQDLSAPNQVPP
jgi:hypothetical protein